ncbi:beta-glucosidase BglX [Flavobacterium franklandianum]|uniref:beta-glucosidase BglX n=1 Tax=Flavobacterium franklandianum TaxID=2594430 RepID=UPI00117A7B8F|nr:beta-glucosidase BglX [Flavobacterium franklandianum]TRX24840.1 beta-glucosidase BglX [Flavobacterium franklandianum]
MNNLKVILLIVISFLTIEKSNAQKMDVESSIEELLAKMTLFEKIGQMNQVNGRNPTDKLPEQIRSGEIGSMLNIGSPELVNSLQKNAREGSRLGIPLLIARDVIHGFKTMFPIPLGQAASFNPEMVELGARIAAKEASEKGIRWTFAPMMDISRDARWGRIAESFGEDTYLAEIMAVAMVKGFQGKDLSNPSSIAACAKHFVAYGAAEGGRDYNSTYVPERQLRNVYLPPFEKAIREANCATVMTSFNANNGIPASGNEFLLKNVLRKEWGFDGIVVSDWGSIKEMVQMGFCEDDKEAALKGVNGGVDVEMTSGTYLAYIETLIAEGKLQQKTIDDAVRNVLRLKFKLGLFDNPYTDIKAKSSIYSPEHLQAAKQAAEESFVLLKNKNNILPLSNKIKTVAIIGPMADAPHDQMGTWTFDGEKAMTQTPLQALRKQYGKEVKFIYEQGLAFSRDTLKVNFSKAIDAAKQADVVLLFVGEEAILSGEAHCLAEINLKGAQSELLEALSKTGKPMVTLVMAGRPLTIDKEIKLSDAVLYLWHPGTMGGPAVADILFGKSVPSGKLPVTFPKYVGQIPVYYNHDRVGRPAHKKETLIKDIPLEAKQSSLGASSYYLDAGFDALFDFGYGLSYTTFEYSNLVLSADSLSSSDVLTVTVDLKNTGKYQATEILQLYTADLAGSIARPIKELKDFKRINLKPGETQKVTFKLPMERLAFWNIDNKKIVEPGKFNLMVGGNSNEVVTKEFIVRQ